MEHESPRSTADVENATPDVPYRLPLNRPPMLEVREIQPRTRADGAVAVIALHDLPSVPAVEVIEHGPSERVFVLPQYAAQDSSEMSATHPKVRAHYPSERDDDGRSMSGNELEWESVFLHQAEQVASRLQRDAGQIASPR